MFLVKLSEDTALSSIFVDLMKELPKQDSLPLSFPSFERYCFLFQAHFLNEVYHGIREKISGLIRRKEKKYSIKIQSIVRKSEILFELKISSNNEDMKRLKQTSNKYRGFFLIKASQKYEIELKSRKHFCFNNDSQKVKQDTLSLLTCSTRACWRVLLRPRLVR